MRAVSLFLVAAPALAGCEPPADLPKSENAAAAPRIAMRNDTHDRLLQLAPDLQRIAMMRAIRDTGNRCQRVDNAGYQQEHRNLRMWVADCGEEAKSWAVFIAPNADIQVRDCAQAGQLALPRCNPLPPAAPSTRSPFREGASANAFRNRF